jgi:hypothetical protein
MVTAMEMERAVDELGITVEGLIEWKSKSKRVYGYGCDQLGANRCMKYKYREEYLPRRMQQETKWKCCNLGRK